MKFVFTEKKYDATDELKAYAERKLSKLDRYFRNEAEVFVTFGHERGRYTLEVTVSYNGMMYRYSDLSSDMYASITAAVASIDRQIRKNKTRLEKRLRSGAFEWDAPVEETDAEVREESEFDLVRTKRFAIKPMTVEEAILQMNLLGHQFFVFEDATTGDTCVVYVRHDGDYGLIVPTK